MMLCLLPLHYAKLQHIKGILFRFSKIIMTIRKGAVCVIGKQANVKFVFLSLKALQWYLDSSWVHFDKVVPAWNLISIPTSCFPSLFLPHIVFPLLYWSSSLSFVHLFLYGTFSMYVKVKFPVVYSCMHTMWFCQIYSIFPPFPIPPPFSPFISFYSTDLPYVFMISNTFTQCLLFLILL